MYTNNVGRVVSKMNKEIMLEKMLKDIKITHPTCTIGKECLYYAGCNLNEVYTDCVVFKGYVTYNEQYFDSLIREHNEILSEKCCSMTNEGGIKYCKDPMHFSEAIVCVNSTFNKDANGLSRCTLDGDLVEKEE